MSSSKIAPDTVKTAVQDVLTEAAEKKRGFVETVELQLRLKDFDPARDKRLGGSIRLPTAPRKAMKLCIFANAKHAAEAPEHGLDVLTIEDLKKINKDKKVIRKLCKKYSAFLCSHSLFAQIPRLIPGLNKYGKFPTPCTDAEKLPEKIDEVSKTIKFASKKDINLGCAIGHAEMTPDELRQNFMLTLNFLISQLKKNWSNVKTVVIKTTMGKPKRVYSS